ncbi:MAG: hypothetical protein SFZ24_05625 [Planctomycetota bacterium]|nr:hypothetical protein [Planctomycetota bacterium]
MKTGWTMPMLTLGALALLAVAWLVPMPGPPSAGSAGSAAPFPPPPPPKKAEIPPEAVITPEPWTQLAGTLDQLTEKSPVAEAQPAETAAPEAAAQAAPVGLVPLGWQYRGQIQGPGGIAALIMKRDRLQFIFKGQRLVDDTDQAGPLIVVKEITPEAVVIDRRGQEERIAYEPGVAINPLVERLGDPRTMR